MNLLAGVFRVLDFSSLVRGCKGAWLFVVLFFESVIVIIVGRVTQPSGLRRSRAKVLEDVVFKQRAPWFRGRGAEGFVRIRAAEQVLETCKGAEVARGLRLQVRQLRLVLLRRDNALCKLVGVPHGVQHVRIVPGRQRAHREEDRKGSDVRRTASCAIRPTEYSYCA